MAEHSNYIQHLTSLRKRWQEAERRIIDEQNQNRSLQKELHVARERLTLLARDPFSRDCILNLERSLKRQTDEVAYLSRALQSERERSQQKEENLLLQEEIVLRLKERVTHELEETHTARKRWEDKHKSLLDELALARDQYLQAHNLCRHRTAELGFLHEHLRVKGLDIPKFAPQSDEIDTYIRVYDWKAPKGEVKCLLETGELLATNPTPSHSGVSSA